MISILKLLAHIEIEVDGDIEKKRVIQIMSQHIPEGAISEEYDGTKDWAIIVNKWTLEEEK